MYTVGWSRNQGRFRPRYSTDRETEARLSGLYVQRKRGPDPVLCFVHLMVERMSVMEVLLCVELCISDSAECTAWPT